MDAATVFVALFAMTVNQVHGVDPVVVRPMMDNRFRPGLADVVCTAAQNAICVLDVADARFEEVLERARRSVLTASKHACVDPRDVAAVVERVQAERGVDLAIHCFLNGVRVTVRIDTAAVAPADAEALAWRLETNALAQAGAHA
ncbi:hypothetical protein [Catenulispora sp. GAS73]|uniref:hypothetical protein n=1 Tax=Catenulispora sp. GAS73 TaxID=3156269 RepID=UPI003513EB2A